MTIILAERWGVDRERAQLAALFHDLAKPLAREKQRALMAKLAAIPAVAEDFEHPAIWHGFASAREAEHSYGIEDREILEAVAMHSTGNPGLSDVGLVLYVADFCEPHRSWEGADAFRGEVLGLGDLREAARRVAQRKLDHLERRGRKAHSRTTAMLQWLNTAV